MNEIILKTLCEECGGDAYLKQIGHTKEVIIEFLEETPITCSCGAETYLQIDKRVVANK